MEYKLDNEQPSGWVKPIRQPTLAELKAQIAETEKDLSALKQRAKALEDDLRLEAIVQIRNIMRAQEITISDITKR
jgi:hypothetical protein